MRVGEKYLPYFNRLTVILKKISEYDKTGDPRINDGTLQRFWEAVNIVSAQMGEEITAECEKAGILSETRKSTRIPALCRHCGKLYSTRVRLSKRNINDVYYGDAEPIRKAKQRIYCSPKCADQAYYMRKKGIEKADGPRLCEICKKPLDPDSSLKRKTCSDKCRKKLERNGKPL